VAQVNYPLQSSEPRFPGELATRGGSYDAVTLTPSGAVAQVSTLTVVAGATTVGPVVVTDEIGRTSSISGAATDTDATSTATSLKSLLEADAVASGTFTISQASGVLTLTARRAGLAFALSSSDSNVTAATSTSASAAPSIPVGVATVQTGAGACDLPRASGNTAQVTTLTPTAANSTLYAVSITMVDRAGQPSYHAQYTSDGSGTAAEISAGLLAAVNTAMPAGSVLASGTDTLVLTSEAPGERFSVASAGVGLLAIAFTTAAVRDPFVGFALRATSVQVGAGYPAWGAGNPATLYSGRDQIAVLCDAAASLSFGDALYYRQVASGAEQLGAIRQDNDGGDCLPLAGWRAAGAHYDLPINGTTYRLCLVERVG
jgi:hypothetical protein